MKRLLIYLGCFLLAGGCGALLQGCETWELPTEKRLSINEGLVAYLPFTKGSLRDSLLDKRVSNNALWRDKDTARIKTNPTFVKGFSDAQDGADLAIFFNGEGDFITLLDNPTLQFKANFSVSMWIKPDVKELKKVGTTEAMQIYHKSAYNGLSNESYSSLIRRAGLTVKDTVTTNSPLTPILQIRSNIKKENTDSRCDKAGPGWQPATFTVDPSIVENDSWHHIAFTYDESTVYVYLDGNLSGSLKLKGGQIQSCPGGDLRFGMGDTQYRFYFKGAMDEIRIYDRQLNDKEVKSLYGLRSIGQ